MGTFSWASFVGGLAFFFFGLYSVREGLQLFAGDRLRVALRRLTNRRLTAFGFGAFVTMILQSSSATTALLVSLAGAQMLNLSQAMAVILGADVGSTAVVFLLATREMTDSALFVAAGGFALYLWSNVRRWRYVGQVLFGFGLVFYGIVLTVKSMQPLQNDQVILDIFSTLAAKPLWSVIAAAAFTALVRSSAATLGLAVSLAFAGVLSLEGAVPLVLGANVGTTMTAALASFGGGINARRVAGAHILTKITGVLIAYPLLGHIIATLQWAGSAFPADGNFSSVLGLQIACAHLLFNVGLACIFLPFLPLGVRIVRWMLPDPVRSEPDFGPKYLANKSVETPSLAFAQAAREVFRIANLVEEITQRSLDMFKVRTVLDEEKATIAALDDKIDSLEKHVRFFLARLSQGSMTETQSQTQLALLNIASALEDIGDTVSKDMVHLAVKRDARKQFFSEEGWSELCGYHSQLMELFSQTGVYLPSRDHDLGAALKLRRRELVEHESELRLAHLQRLHSKQQESVETSSIHLDLLGSYRYIAQKLGHIASQAENI